MENLFDPLFDSEETTVSGNNDPLDRITSVCPECGSTNGNHLPDCEDFLGAIEYRPFQD